MKVSVQDLLFTLWHVFFSFFVLADVVFMNASDVQLLSSEVILILNSSLTVMK